MPADPTRFISRNLRLVRVPAVPEVLIYTAHARSGLSRLQRRQSRDADLPPYWAHPWAGGIALARYFLSNPSLVAGRHVLDLGAGSGLVGIAAALAGAAHVTAAETDVYGRAAIALNARANGVAVTVTDRNFLHPEPGAPQGFDLIAMGDMFYNASVAERATDFLGRCQAASIDILVGDPGRTFLPRDQFETIAEYHIPDFGAGPGVATAGTGVFRMARSGAETP